MMYEPTGAKASLDPTGTTREAMTAGELAYQFAALADGYLAGNLSDQSVNDVLGALTRAQHEVYRRLAAPLEDSRRYVNGDIFATKAPHLPNVKHVDRSGS